MNLKVGDKIKVYGREGTIASIAAAGKYTRYTLDDGRVYLDLLKLVEKGDAKVTTPLETMDHAPFSATRYEDEDEEEEEEDPDDRD